jgi:DNA-binding NtrC family response regulator
MNKKILICDDQELIREVLSGFLKTNGFDVSLASNGEQCLEQISKEQFDVIILDVKMPDIDGVSVINKVKEKLGHSQVILISGQVSEEALKNLGLPCYSFFKKPFSLHSILERLKTLAFKETSKILVVDDQDFLREMLCEYLKSQGFEVEQASNGQEAVALAGQQDFDGIFMDVRMPDVSGVDALKQLQESGIKTPVILMSGFGDVTSLEDAKALGAVNFLAKPFKLEAASLALAGI